jgi:hypothetical protein
MMSEFEAQEIKARIALRELKEKTKLVKVIKRKGNLLMSIWFALCIISLAIPCYFEIDFADNSSAVGFLSLMTPLLLIFSLIVNVNHKLNTLVELLEVDKCLLKDKNETEN